MSPERTRHLVEAELADQGWSVYRLVLGGGPAIVVTRAEPWAAPRCPVVVAVARASEPRGGRGAYPRLERAEGADVLASVTSDGAVRFFDAQTGSEATRLADLLCTTPEAPQALLSPLPRGDEVVRA